ncbi:MAG: hypothetical protein A2901_06600, partial [Elusimicrobia bacterium RIFCSPLOWO2_01_FULL_54_10]
MNHLTVRKILALTLAFSLEAPASWGAALGGLEETFAFFEQESRVTTVSKQEENLSEAPGVITVITRDELERFGGTTLRDILERVPSLTGSTVYMTDRSIISVRGAQTKENGVHVLLLINGRPVREILEGGIVSETLESFPVNVIERIEVIRGPGSVLHGSGAFSGVINVITEKAEKSGGSVLGMGGERGAYNAEGKAKIRNGDLSVIAAGKYHDKTNWRTAYSYASPAGNAAGTQSSMPNKGPGAYVGMDYKNLRVMSSYSQWENYYFIPSFLTLFSSLGYACWKKGFTNFGYDLQASDQWKMDFNFTYTHSTFEISSWPNFKRDSYELVGEWTNHFNPTEEFHLALGVLHNYVRGKEHLKDVGYISDGKRNSYAFYTQMDYWLLENLKLIGGGQLNKVEAVDADFVPRGGLIYYPFPELNFKALYSQAFRAPSLNEVGLNHPGLKGNPNVKSEKVSTVDVGFNYAKEQIRLGLNYFNSKQTDIIVPNRSGKFAVPTYDNMGEIHIHGVEFEGKYSPEKKWLLLGSVLYQNSKDKEGNGNVTPIANWGAKAGVSYKSDTGAALSLFDSFQGDLDDKYKGRINPSPESHHLLNLHGKLDPNKFFGLHFGRDWSFVLQADNLLNREIWQPNWGSVRGTSTPVTQGR